ncbi:MAG: potassium channel family protein [Thermoleophilia bacterium]
MYVVIAGCGRVGSSLALDLVAEGHDLAVIDENPDAFGLLGEDFPGQFVIGQAIDWEILRAAGIDHADSFVAATDGDNTNIIVAQIAKERFGVKCAVARVFDPARADLFAEAGIRTVCPTKDAKDLLHEAVNTCKIEHGIA